VRSEVLGGEEVKGARALPTYNSIADAMSEENGAGIRLAGWTVGRAVLIVPGLRLAGIPWTQTLAGSMFASTTISALSVLRFSHVARKDVPMKALAWLGILGVGAAGAYWLATKDEKKAEETVDYSVTNEETYPVPGADDPPLPGPSEQDTYVAPGNTNINPARRTMQPLGRVPLLTGFNRTGLRVGYTGRRYF